MNRRSLLSWLASVPLLRRLPGAAMPVMLPVGPYGIMFPWELVGEMPLVGRLHLVQELLADGIIEPRHAVELLEYPAVHQEATPE